MNYFNPHRQIGLINYGRLLFACNTFAYNLFDGIVSCSTSREVAWVIDVVIPRFDDIRCWMRIEHEEGEVAVGHVVVLSAVQEPRHDQLALVTVGNHCTTQRHDKAAVHFAVELCVLCTLKT